jgi:molybdopterin molybdotransferase
MSVAEARACVIAEVRQGIKDARPLEAEAVALDEALGRVLAEDVPADRDYPALPRSIRDGFAVRSVDLPGSFEVIGESRAGGSFSGEVGKRQAVEIMTGAPVPKGADQIVMVEHATVNDKGSHGAWVTTERAAKAGEFINPRASEIRRGETFVPAGRRIGIAEVAGLATVGCTRVPVFRQPRVAILSTGDEVVGIEAAPEGNQVRNSNAWALAAQVRRAGGVPTVLPVAPDDLDATAELIGQGLQHDLLLLSGGVSAGKYDYVEGALLLYDAKFYFDRVLIQPGQPLVFGRASRGKYFFGLPGNPASTMVCFEVFGRAAVELLSGQTDAPLATAWARLTHEFSHKPGLTRFLGATLRDGEVTQVASQGSSDVAALAKSDCFLIAEPERERWAAGEMIRVLLR